MDDSRYSLLIAIALGIAHMCMFVGYDTGSFIVESVLHSVHDRKPTEMNEHAGYYGSAIVNSFNMIGHIVAPAVLCLINAKWTMAIGSVFFAISFASYILINEYLIYVCSALLGLMYAVFTAGYSLYLMQISTIATMEKLNGLEWSICNLSTFFGGCIVIIVTLTNSNSSESSLYIEYSDTQIRLIYGAFTALGAVAVLIFSLLPNRAVADSISSIAIVEEKGGKAAKMRNSVTLTLKTFFDPLVLQLTPHFIYVGWQTSVWISIYPTAIQFTESISDNALVVSYYGMAFSLGNLTMGGLTGPLSRRIAQFGQVPCLIVAACLQLLSGTLVLLSTPNQSTIAPNDDHSLLIPFNVPLAIVMGFLFGALDNCNCTNRTVMCAITLPSRRSQVFAIARFWQAFASSILLFCSSFLTTYMMLGIEAILLVVGVAFYIRVAFVLNQQREDGTTMENDVPSRSKTIESTTSMDAEELNKYIAATQSKRPSNVRF